MPRIARVVVKGEPAAQHVISRTALDGFVLGYIEKEYLVELIRDLSKVYLAEVLGFCDMGNHFDLLAIMHQDEEYTDNEDKDRYRLYYNKDSDEELNTDNIS